MTRVKLHPICLAIVDVGHGNSAVLKDSRGTVVIDAGPRAGLMEFLLENGIRTIDVLLLSHADQDHIGGLVALLAADEFEIKLIRVNTDSQKSSAIWDDLLFELSHRHDGKQIDFQPNLVSSGTREFDRGEVHVDILGPSSYLAAKGPGSTDRKGRLISSNSISAVIRLSYAERSFALFAGDLDDVGLEDLMAREIDAKADLLVFPHHGGRAGATTDPAAFASRLCGYVRPKHVVFSIGRRETGQMYPRPDVMAAILGYDPTLRVSCTQLSKLCASSLPTQSPRHIRHAYAKGEVSNKCCAGTIVLDVTAEVTLPLEDEHVQFVTETTSSAQCRLRTGYT